MIDHKRYTNEKKWVSFSLAATALAVMLYALSDFMYGGIESSVRGRGAFSLILIAVSIAALAIAVVAFFKAKGKAKLLPGGSAFVLLLVLAASFIVAAFSGFAGSH